MRSPNTSRSAAGMPRPGDSASSPRSWPAFAAAFSGLARPFGADSARAEVQRPGRQVVDLVLPARFLDWGLADELLRLAPFGPGHLEPVLAVTGLRVAGARRIGAREAHVSFRMLRGLEIGRCDRVRRRRRARAPRGGDRAGSRRHPRARRVRWHAPPSPAGDRLRRCGRQPARRSPSAGRGAGARRMTTPLERLRARVAALGAPLCLGIDPHPDDLPDGRGWTSRPSPAA